MYDECFRSRHCPDCRKRAHAKEYIGGKVPFGKRVQEKEQIEKNGEREVLYNLTDIIRTTTSAAFILHGYKKDMISCCKNLPRMYADKHG